MLPADARTEMSGDPMTPALTFTPTRCIVAGVLRDDHFYVAVDRGAKDSEHIVALLTPKNFVMDTIGSEGQK